MPLIYENSHNKPTFKSFFKPYKHHPESRGALSRLFLTTKRKAIMKEQNESIARYMGWTTEKSKGFDWWHNPAGQRVGTESPDYSTDHQAMAEVMEKLINTKNVYEVRTTTQISCEVVIEMVNELIYKSVGPTEIAAKFAAVVQFLEENP